MHKASDVLLGEFDTREQADAVLHREAEKLRLWKLTRRFRVFVEELDPFHKGTVWGVWLRKVNQEESK